MLLLHTDLLLVKEEEVMSTFPLIDSRSESQMYVKCSSITMTSIVSESTGSNNYNMFHDLVTYSNRNLIII